MMETGLAQVQPTCRRCRKTQFISTARKGFSTAVHAAYDLGWLQRDGEWFCGEECLAMADQPIRFAYTNYRGELSVREAVPRRLWFGSTQYHPEAQWMMTAYDTGKKADRDFALSDCDFSASTGWRSTDG